MIYTQASGAGVKQLLAAAISTGVEELCSCGFSTSNIAQIILQCFPDNPAKINVLFLLQETPTRNISEIIAFVNVWINSGPLIVLDENNTTVSVDGDCDVKTVQGSDCTLPTSMPTSSPAPTNKTNNETTTDEPSVSVVKSESKGQDLTTVGGTFLGVGIFIIVASVCIVLFVLVRFRVIKIGSLSL